MHIDIYVIFTSYNFPRVMGTENDVDQCRLQKITESLQ